VRLAAHVGKLDCVLVIEHGWPPGPSFLYSLGSLIEAAVIHERVYFDPLNYTQREDSKAHLHAFLRGSSFVSTLSREQVLTLFPPPSEVDRTLSAKGHDYTATQFLIDSTYEGVSFASADPAGEKTRYELRLDLFAIPKIFHETELIEHFGGQALRFANEAALQAMSRLGFNYRDLRIIGAYNRRALAFLDLARNLDLNLYPSFSAIPHYVGAVQQTNSKARKTYETIKGKLLETDDEAEVSRARASAKQSAASKT